MCKCRNVTVVIKLVTFYHRCCFIRGPKLKEKSITAELLMMKQNAHGTQISVL